MKRSKKVVKRRTKLSDSSLVWRNKYRFGNETAFVSNIGPTKLLALVVEAHCQTSVNLSFFT